MDGNIEVPDVIFRVKHRSRSSLEPTHDLPIVWESVLQGDSG